MELEVYFKNILAGKLWRDNSGYHFAYNNDFLNDKNTGPISVNMPKSRTDYHSDMLFPIFQSMLPEGYNRKLQCEILGIDPQNDWDVLTHTCQNDTIGAITVRKADYL